MSGAAGVPRDPHGLAAARARSVEVRAAMPKCGARRKHDGAPCTQPVAEEGKRCRYHGGRTPKGADWHKPQFPQRGAPIEKLGRKLADLERRRAAQAARRRAMTPDEKARYDAWHATHASGGPARRKRRADALAARALIEEAMTRAQDAARPATAPDCGSSPPPACSPIATPAVKGSTMADDPKARPRADAQPWPERATREVLRRNLDRLRTEGLEAATEAAIQILRDPSSPAQARSAVANSVFKASGVLDSAQDALAPEKRLEDMTMDEITQKIAELEQRARGL